MKKNVFFLAVAVIMMAASSSFAQKVLVEQKKTNDLNSKIRECNVKIAQYTNDLDNAYDYSGDIKRSTKQIDSLNKLTYDTQHGRELRDAKVKGIAEELRLLEKKQKTYVRSSWKISAKDALIAQVKKYEAEKEQIFQAYVTDTKVPVELSKREVKLRKNGLEIRHDDRVETNQARLEDLGYKKLANSSVIADSINGYEGIIANITRYDKIEFLIYSVDEAGNRISVEEVAFVTNPGDRLKYNLLPGTYCCEMIFKGKTLTKRIFHSSPQKHYVMGEWTHFGLVWEG